MRGWSFRQSRNLLFDPVNIRRTCTAGQSTQAFPGMTVEFLNRALHIRLRSAQPYPALAVQAAIAFWKT